MIIIIIIIIIIINNAYISILLISPRGSKRNLLSYFWGNDLSFCSLLMKLFEHFNLSILRISAHFKWEFFVNTKNVVVFSVVLCGANEISEFSLGEGSSSSTLFLVEVKNIAEISLKISKIGLTKLMYVK